MPQERDGVCPDYLRDKGMMQVGPHRDPAAFYMVLRTSLGLIYLTPIPIQSLVELLVLVLQLEMVKFRQIGQ